MAEFAFYCIAFCTCLFAVLTVISRDIFHSAVWLAFTLLSVAGIYFYLDAEFLGIIQVLVYVGGIITLFVFAIKLTAKIGDTTIRQVNRQMIPAGAVAFILFVLFLKMISHNPWAQTSLHEKILSLQELGQSLMTTYVFPFEFMSLILLAAMIGAIVIGKVKQ